MSKSQPLPPKEHGIFKRILKCYEQKQYKNGLKFAKQILSNPKFQDHGETLAMKGLTFNAMGRREEAYEEVKRGLKSDIRSHICWHVYGVLQRADKKYDEAIKCYRNALKLDPDNLQILKDLSLLQIQMRDLEGFKETRYRLLQLKPSQRNGWLGYAVSYHLLNDHTMAAAILSQYRQCTSEHVAYESSELALFENFLLCEAGQYQSALDHLEANETVIVDRLVYLETWAKLLEVLGKPESAALIYKKLLMRNPENRAYYVSVERTTLPQTEEERLAIYSYVALKRPFASLPKRLVLDFLTGDRLRERLGAYMRKYFLKGFAPLFNLLRSLYSDKEKVQLIGTMVEGYRESLSQCGKFNPEDSEPAPPSVEIWLLVYLAHHYSFTHQIKKALDCVNCAIEHTPTLVELYMLKGKIYKRAGNYVLAAQWVNEGRLLDTADRYVNCLCAKYLLRSDQIETAEETCRKFTREGMNAAETLNEMQCMWYQTECAFSYSRQQRWGEALKKCHEIEKHFVDMTEDQFDFHYYCMRKTTLRAYVGLLRLEDDLRSHPFYFKTAHLAIEIYLHLHEHPQSGNDGKARLDGADLTDSEKKKLRNKERKAKKKAAQLQQKEEAAAAAAAQKKDAAKTSESDKKEGDALRPEALVQTSQPLEEAIKFLKPLQLMASGRIETHLLAYRIYSKKCKILMMLSAIKKAAAIDSNHPELHEHIVDFALAVKTSSNLSDVVQRVVSQELPALLDSKDVESYNKLYLERNANSLRHLLSGCKVWRRLKPDETNSALALLTNLSGDLEDGRADICTSVLEALASGAFGSCADAVASYRAACFQLFPHASAFQVSGNGEEEREAPCGGDVATGGSDVAENSLRDTAAVVTAEQR